MPTVPGTTGGACRWAGRKMASIRTKPTIIWACQTRKASQRSGHNRSTSSQHLRVKVTTSARPRRLQRTGTRPRRRPVSNHATSPTTKLNTPRGWYHTHFHIICIGEGEAGSRKRFQRVEILKIAEPCPLIDPSQVVVTQGEILVADPVLTPIGNGQHQSFACLFVALVFLL